MNLVRSFHNVNVATPACAPEHVFFYPCCHIIIFSPLCPTTEQKPPPFSLLTPILGYTLPVYQKMVHFAPPSSCRSAASPSSCAKCHSKTVLACSSPGIPHDQPKLQPTLYLSIYIQPSLIYFDRNSTSERAIVSYLFFKVCYLIYSQLQAKTLENIFILYNVLSLHVKYISSLRPCYTGCYKLVQVVFKIFVENKNKIAVCLICLLRVGFSLLSFFRDAEYQEQSHIRESVIA